MELRDYGGGMNLSKTMTTTDRKTITVLSLFPVIFRADWSFMFLNVIPPLAFMVIYFETYKPMIRKVQEEVDLEFKYPFLYSKFTNGGKG